MTATAPVHADATTTERAAAKKASRWADSLEARALSAVVAAGDRGLTVLEALDVLGMPQSKRYSLAPRLSALSKHKGYLRLNGESRDDCGVYVATPAGRQQAGGWTVADLEAAEICGCAHTRYLHRETTGKCVRRACGCTVFRPSGQVARVDD